MRFAKWLLPCLVLLVAEPAMAYKIQISEEASLNLDVLLQAQAQFTEKASPSAGWSKDFFMRRIRLLAFGNVFKNVSFFFETDQPNFGKNGDWSGPMFVQDAFMTFKVVDEFMVDAGMIIVPYSRHSVQGAIALNSLDYHGKMVKYPDGSHKVWRDAGLQLRGYVFDKKFSYRLGVFAGSQNVALQKDAAGKAVLNSNPDDLPRVAGLLRYSILGTETDFFFKGIHFATAPILSVGAGVDFVPKSVCTKKAVLDATTNAVTAAGELGHHLAISGDVYLDYPINEDNELVVQGTFMFNDAGAISANSGIGGFGELGYRWRFIEPVVQFDYFKSDLAKSDYMGMHFGLNWWIAKHATNFKVDFAMEKTGDVSNAPFIKSVTLQGQLFL